MQTVQNTSVWDDIQAAVMAIRVATEGDPSFPYHPESGYRRRKWEGYKTKCASSFSREKKNITWENI